jgi:plastocyanin
MSITTVPAVRRASQRRPTRGLLAIAAAVTALLAGCASSSSSTPAGAGRTTTTVSSTTTGAAASTDPAPTPPDTTATRIVGSGATVEITDHRFVPKHLEVTRGIPVTWVNHDDVEHRIVSTLPNVLDSGEIGKAQGFTQTFNRPGTYPYFCKIHNYMKGTIDVR